MLSAPNVYTLAAEAVTTSTTFTGEWFEDLEGVEKLTAILKLEWGSGGSTIKGYLQTAIDDTDTPIDIACITFAMASKVRVYNFTADTSVTTPITPTDGALPDDTAVGGILGNKFRFKFVSTGTYAGSTAISARIHAR